TEDNFGRIYVGTARGINRVEPETGRIKLYTQADGLPGSAVSRCARDEAGNLWFSQKFNLARLEVHADENFAPPIFIGDLRVNGETVKKLSELGETTVENLDFNSEQRQIQIGFFALGFGTGETLRYQYKLAAADWSEPSAQRTVNLNLAPGSYNFLVRAVNAEGTPSENPARVAFTIARPVWQRWWFLITAALVISFLIYAVYRYRVAQIIRLERVRTRIATDLHDDIGSSLSKIAILSEVVRQKSGSTDANEPLAIIADTSREMVDSMSDIVWAINPERDKLSDLIQRMRRFAEELLDAQDIGYQFFVPENLKDVALGADVRREIYLIFKECVNNLAKHSGASEAYMKVDLENESLVVEVRDDGRGFDQSAKSNGNSHGFGGNGLINMRRRAESLGGALAIDSEPGKGAKIVLRVPVGKKLFAV
ncbi:MAG TPA: ATP-binding protein, partial [Pyrinomonadaceae bacterium]